MQNHLIQKILGFFLLLAVSCNQPEHSRKEVMPMPVKTDSVKPELKDLAFGSKTDLVCGMPLKAGVEDTLHYKGNLYGFCAKECKEDFLKDPEKYIAGK